MQHPVYQQPHAPPSEGSGGVYDVYDEYRGGGGGGPGSTGSTNHYGGSDPGYDSHQMIQQQYQQVKRNDNRNLKH